MRNTDGPFVDEATRFIVRKDWFKREARRIVGNSYTEEDYLNYIRDTSGGVYIPHFPKPMSLNQWYKDVFEKGEARAISEGYWRLERQLSEQKFYKLSGLFSTLSFSICEVMNKFPLWGTDRIDRFERGYSLGEWLEEKEIYFKRAFWKHSRSERTQRYKQIELKRRLMNSN